MSWVCKPVRAAGTGAYGHGDGLRFSNPHPTRTRDAGTAGFVHECYIYLVLALWALGNDMGQPNPTGSRVRVSLGSGAGHGESTRDPGPTHLKGNSQRRPTAANEGQCRPTKTKKGPNDASRVVWAFFNVHFIFH